MYLFKRKSTGNALAEYALPLSLVVLSTAIAVQLVNDGVPDWVSRGLGGNLAGDKINLNNTVTGGAVGNGGGFNLMPKLSGELSFIDMSQYETDLLGFAGSGLLAGGELPPNNPCFAVGVCRTHRDATERPTVENALKALAAEQQRAIDEELRRQREERLRQLAEQKKQAEEAAEENTEETVELAEEAAEEAAELAEEIEEIAEELETAEKEMQEAEGELLKELETAVEDAKKALETALAEVVPPEPIAETQEALDTAADIVAKLADPNQSAVNALYKDLLGREGDAGGVEYWSEMVNTGKLSLSDVATNFKMSAEYTAANPPPPPPAPVAAPQSAPSAPQATTTYNQPVTTSHPTVTYYNGQNTVQVIDTTVNTLNQGGSEGWNTTTNEVAWEVAYTMGQNSGYPPADIVKAASEHSGLPAAYVPPSTATYNKVKTNKEIASSCGYCNVAL